MRKFKSFFFIVGAVVLVVASHIVLAPLLKRTLVPVSLAEDDDEEDDEEDEDEEKIEYETVYTKLPDEVVTTTTEVPRYDSDKDGTYDDEDPHPGINDFLIVKDDNLNGIDDKYESK